MSGRIVPAIFILTAALLFLPGSGAGGPGWSGAVLIDAGAGNNAYDPQVAMDGSGGAVAVFEQDDGGNWRVYANRYDGSSWTGATTIDAGPGCDAFFPRVAISENREAVAVFKQTDGVSWRIYANRYDGSSWTGATIIDAGPGKDAEAPQVAMDASGRAIAVFEQSDGDNWRVYANHYNGTSWSGSTTIDNGPGSDAEAPWVAMDGSGQAVVVFLQYDGDNWRVYYNRWDGTSWNHATTIDAGPGNDADAPRVAMDASGHAVAVFCQFDGIHWPVYASRWDGSSWSVATTIDSGSGNNADNPEVAMDGSGHAVAVFQQKTDDIDRVYANCWDGGSWSGATTIDVGMGSHADFPAVAMTAVGTALAVFQQKIDGQARVYANRWVGLRWCGAEVIDASPEYRAILPQVAMDGEGSGVALFLQSDGSNWRVYANRFSPSSAPWIYDYNGDGTSDIAIFRPSSGLWAVRGVTRVYFGSSGDLIVPADYDGDGTTDIAIFRQASGLWAVRGVTRVYFGSSNDIPVPGDYRGDGTDVPAIYRPGSGLWAVRGVTRIYFGGGADIPVPGYYAAGGSKSVGIFRPASGLWAIRGLTRVYFGSSGDSPVPGDYRGEGVWPPAIFRPDTGLWAVRGATRVYFGGTDDRPVPGGYDGGGTDSIGIFRPDTGLWAVRGLTRVYFGGSGDLPAAR